MVNNEMKEALVRALKRGARAAVAVFISSVVAALTQEPSWLWLAPVLLAGDKFVRDLLEEK